MADSLDMDLCDAMTQLAQQTVEVNCHKLGMALGVRLPSDGFVDETVSCLSMQRAENGPGNINFNLKLDSSLVLFIKHTLLAFPHINLFLK